MSRWQASRPPVPRRRGGGQGGNKAFSRDGSVVVGPDRSGNLLWHAVNGHVLLPTGGQRVSPRTVMRIPRVWTWFSPAGVGQG